jgi:hypothetical protein
VFGQGQAVHKALVHVAHIDQDGIFRVEQFGSLCRG